MSEKKTRRVGIICNPVGPTQAEIQRRIQEHFDRDMAPKRPIPVTPFKFPENPDVLIITSHEEYDTE